MARFFSKYLNSKSYQPANYWNKLPKKMRHLRGMIEISKINPSSAIKVVLNFLLQNIKSSIPSLHVSFHDDLDWPSFDLPWPSFSLLGNWGRINSYEACFCGICVILAIYWLLLIGEIGVSAFFVTGIEPDIRSDARNCPPILFSKN